MSALNAHLNVICKDFRAVFPLLKSAEPHRGRFTLAELKRMGAKLPALRIALGNVSKVTVEADDRRDVTCEFWATVITRDTRGLPRHEASVNIVDALVLHLPGHDFGNPSAFGVEDITAANLFTGDVDASGVMMWDVRFRQTLRLATSGSLEDSIMPGHLYVGQSPEIGVDHQQDYRDALTGEAP